jgi:hypothetical protein
VPRPARAQARTRAGRGPRAQPGDGQQPRRSSRSNMVRTPRRRGSRPPTTCRRTRRPNRHTAAPGPRTPQLPCRVQDGDHRAAAAGMTRLLLQRGHQPLRIERLNVIRDHRVHPRRNCRRFVV